MAVLSRKAEKPQARGMVFRSLNASASIFNGWGFEGRTDAVQRVLDIEAANVGQSHRLILIRIDPRPAWYRRAWNWTRARMGKRELMWIFLCGLCGLGVSVF